MPVVETLAAALVVEHEMTTEHTVKLAAVAGLAIVAAFVAWSYITQTNLLPAAPQSASQ